MLAVKVTRSGDTDVFDTAEAWAALADPNNAIRTTDRWEKHFRDWGGDARNRAEQAALAGFQPIAKQFVAERAKSLQAEGEGQRQWLQKRAEEITGTPRSAEVQRTRFDEPSAASGEGLPPPSWIPILVQETLGPQVAERSPQDDPKPCEILGLKVLDPAMGSGHFLVEACRFLGHHLYEAARLCDERAMDAERRAERGKTKKEREAAEAQARDYRQRVIDLPDPDDEIVRYLPSRSPEGEESGISQRKAEALCRRMVAVHCLYGVDKNPLAVELAKLALWLESHAEGMPLTFLDQR